MSDIKKMKYLFFYLILHFIASYSVLFAQQQEKQMNPKSQQQDFALKRDFRGAALLENYETIMKKLKSDTVIMVDPDSDFGDFDEEHPGLIKAKIPQYMEHIYYQFFKNKLFSISLFFNRERYDYLGIYKKLKAKYGKPVVYNSLNTIWEDSQTIIILDNLPSIKYIDKESFKAINQGKEFLQKDQIKENILEDL